MNIQGKLIEIFDTIQITETFKKREFILQDNKNPEYPEFIKVELIQDKVSLLDNLNIGDEPSRNGRIFVSPIANSIQGWKIESENLNLNQDNNDDNFNQDSGEDLPF